MQTNLVTTNKQGVVTDSLTVAEKFGKRHKDVLKKIENILRDDEDTRLNFAPSEYKDPTGRSLKKYIMDRKSFSILCMSFSGKKALNWKIKFKDSIRLPRTRKTDTALPGSRTQTGGMAWNKAR